MNAIRKKKKSKEGGRGGLEILGEIGGRRKVLVETSKGGRIRSGLFQETGGKIGKEKSKFQFTGG